jgi:MFS family permease
MVGVLLAAALLWWFTGSPTHGEATAGPGVEECTFRVVFGVAAALGVGALALTFLVREPERSGAFVEPFNESPAGRLGLPASYWRTIAVLLVFSFANSSDAFLLLRATDLGMSPWAVVLAYAVFNVTYALASYPAGIISDRLGRWRVIALGWAIYAAVYAGFALTGAPGVWPLFALYGVSMALTDGVGKALVADHAPREKRGTALGIYYMASGLMTMVASLVAGVLWDRVGPAGAFGVGAVGAAIAVALVPLLRPRSIV